MPSDGPPRAHRNVLLATAAGAGAPLLLAALGQVEAGPAVLSALGVAGCGLWLTRRAFDAARPAADTAGEAAPAVASIPYADILENLGDPVMVIAADEPFEVTGHRLVFANRAARDLFRIYRPDVRLITAIRNPQIIELVEEALFGGVGGDTTFETGAAQDRSWTAVASPLAPAPWGASMALLILRDQTDLRRAERMRADFLANASHELRTPLASLSGFIETLRGPARNDVAARDKFLGIMQAQAERMSRLIDDLMSLSRIELNEHIAPLGRVDLSAAVTDVTDALMPVVRAKGVSFAWSPPGRDQIVVEGDRDQIVQVIQNLVDNAVKYTPAGGVIGIEIGAPVEGDAPPARDPEATRLPLLTPEHRAGGAYALLRVSDQGPGMPRDALPRLTERFYRVEGQKSGDKSGTGLGLAIVKHIVNRHKGGLAAETVLGRGSTFSAWFPLSPPVDARVSADAVAKVS
ncbi:MAG: ATP-binding protein [Caulobacter sp.]|nr:ATP-binding protein [Caulobacter sp.]